MAAGGSSHFDVDKAEDILGTFSQGFTSPKNLISFVWSKNMFALECSPTGECPKVVQVKDALVLQASLAKEHPNDLRGELLNQYFDLWCA